MDIDGVENGNPLYDRYHGLLHAPLPHAPGGSVYDFKQIDKPPAALPLISSSSGLLSSLLRAELLS